MDPLAGFKKTLAYLYFLSYTNVGCGTQDLEWPVNGVCRSALD
jgi:hypothetical protein